MDNAESAELTYRHGRISLIESSLFDGVMNATLCTESAFRGDIYMACKTALTANHTALSDFC